MDLRYNQGLLDTGTVYLQADNIDMKPWFTRWLRANRLESADFSLAGLAAGAERPDRRRQCVARQGRRTGTPAPRSTGWTWIIWRCRCAARAPVGSSIRAATAVEHRRPGLLQGAFRAVAAGKHRIAGAGAE